MDRHIPVALILAILAQSAGALWWASGMNSRVISIEAQVMQMQPQGDRLTRVETRLDGILASLEDIKASLRARTATR